MVQLILGGSASGKSEFAGSLAEKAARNGTIHYLATMHPEGKEAQEKIRRHDRLRIGGSYQVHEVFSIDALRGAGEKTASDDVILFDSIDGFAADVMFSPKTENPGTASPDEARQLAAEILLLEKNCRCLILVADDIGSDGVSYDPVTRRYMEYYGILCRCLGESAHSVVQVVCGIPVWLKGED